MSLVRERIAAGVAEHVNMGLKAQLSLDASALDHASEPSGGERCPTVRREHEG